MHLPCTEKVSQSGSIQRNKLAAHGKNNANLFQKAADETRMRVLNQARGTRISLK
jgi:hypothetical protein